MTEPTPEHLVGQPAQPMAGPLASREDLQSAVRALWAPVRDRLSPGCARARLGATGAHFPASSAELEGFSRPLWGLVPLAAGGGELDWTPYIRGLGAGSDPDHPEYWGAATSRRQDLVEMAAIGLALAMVPEQVWDPLTGRSRDDLAAWLAGINEVETADNNWLFFRVMVNLGLARVGAKQYDPDAAAAALDRLDSFYLGDGWYSDGPTSRRDHYIPWAMHYYGLIYAALAGDRDPARAEQFRERAGSFATDFVHWFADDGSALPFGRSLTYRFAQGAFWGALAYADVDVLPWGVVKGLLMRHLRWWAQLPIFDQAGLLTIGYGYPNLNMAEEYNSPGSPYWAMKAFLPLALPADHPFWLADEEPLSESTDDAQPAGAAGQPRAGTTAQPHPGLVLYRERGHVVALASGQDGPWTRHGAEKYAKFAYSTEYGFSVPVGMTGLNRAGHDSMLAVSDDGEHWRVRETCAEAAILSGDVVWSRWSPMAGVEVETWLLARPPWHVRVHRLRTDLALHTAEGGWSLDRTGDDPANLEGTADVGEGFATASYPAGHSVVRDLHGRRDGEVVRMAPNANLLHPRTVLPTLRARHEVGEYWLACAVVAGTSDLGDPPTLDDVRAALPEGLDL